MGSPLWSRGDDVQAAGEPIHCFHSGPLLKESLLPGAWHSAGLAGWWVVEEQAASRWDGSRQLAKLEEQSEMADQPSQVLARVFAAPAAATAGRGSARRCLGGSVGEVGVCGWRQNSSYCRVVGKS